LDGRSSLEAQIPALRAEIGVARSALERVRVLEPDLHKRVSVRFEDLIGRGDRRLSELSKRVDDGQSMKECWSEFTEIREGCAEAFSESLAFLQGALMRREDLDFGMCRVADALLNDLSLRADLKWGRLTVLAEGEFYGSLAQIIRLRFPMLSIWNLPVVAHEFGHYVGPEIRMDVDRGRIRSLRYPFQELLAIEAKRGPTWWSYLHEEFADVFAVYVLGPAYACTCALLRFDPSGALTDGFQHPSPARRMHLVLGTLRRMDAGTGVVRPYRGITDQLEGLWATSVAAAGLEPDLGAAAIQELDDRLAVLYEVLAGLPGSLSYRSFHRAQGLSAQLRPGEAPVKLEGDVTLADVLNAAWLCRLESWDRHLEAVIAERAAEACQRLADHMLAQVSPS
jgi:hypothetical protein